MISSRELMIGNFIRPINYPIKNFYTTVLGIFEDKVWLPYEGRPKQCFVGNYEYIPLTEEWLRKFGFSFSGSFIQFTNGYFSLIWNDNKVSLQVEGQWLSLEIKYVHQLQRLYFALTGSELTLIEL